MIASFKLILLGDREVGKSNYLSRLLTGEFNKRYVGTLPYENIKDVYFTTSCGVVKFTIWESAGGSENWLPLRDDQQYVYNE
jgi:GTP-binding nuclear protein Ran